MCEYRQGLTLHLDSLPSRLVQVRRGTGRLGQSARASDLDLIYRTAQRHNVAYAFWLELRDGQGAGPFTRMGLMKQDGQRKPSYGMYQKLSAELKVDTAPP